MLDATIMLSEGRCRGMSNEDVQKKRLNEEKEIRKALQSIPSPHDVDGGLRPEITANKLIWIFIKHSRCLNRLTLSLIVLTALLALVTIADILVRLFLQG